MSSLEQKQIDRIFEILQNNIEEVRELIEEFNDLKYDMSYGSAYVKLNNVAITLNNKIVEIGQLFNRKGLAFYSECKLSFPILKQLNTYYKYAIKSLKESISLYHQIENYYEGESDNELNLIKFHIQIYQHYEDIIWKYDIQNDLNSYIQSEGNSYPNKIKYKELLKKYREELELLGYNNLVASIDTMIDDKDISREKFLKDYKVSGKMAVKASQDKVQVNSNSNKIDGAEMDLTT